MSDVEHFAVLVLVVGAAIIAAVLLNRISERIRIPAPAIFLVAAALASDAVPALGSCRLPQGVAETGGGC
jgi:cell volume regulation protein A